MHRRIMAFLLGGLGAVAVVSLWRPEPIPADPTAIPVATQPRRSTVADSIRQVRRQALGQIDRADTYIPVMLVQGDSILKRWPERQEPLAVYLPDGHAAGYLPEMGLAARDAFSRWQRVGDIPVSFRFVRDSTRADVIVQWIDRFSFERTGQAEVRWNGLGWLLSGRLTLATTSFSGYPLPPEAVYTVALHEIGHLLGLGHSDDPRDVMFPTTDVHDMTPRDRRTARLLYALPPGSLRVP